MTVVFGPDTFTVSSDIGLALYPSGSPTYAYNIGSGTNLTVNAANDRIQAVTTGSDWLARCTHASMPTGDQEVTATVSTAASGVDNSGNLAVRVATDNTANGYNAYVNLGNTIWLYRIEPGPSFVSLGSTTRTFSTGAHTGRFRATGTNPVNLEYQLDALAVFTVSDSSANRRTAGVPGVEFFCVTANAAFVDNFQVDDLVVAGAVTPQHTTFILGQALARASRY